MKHSGSFKKGHPGYWRGKKQTKDVINKRIKRGEDHYNWKGGKTLDSNGYVLIYNPQHPNPVSKHYVFEHVLVMERSLGRYLKKGEQIHHKGTRYPINDIKNKQDNNIENLQLFPSSSAHQKFHQELKRRIPFMASGSQFP